MKEFKLDHMERGKLHFYPKGVKWATIFEVAMPVLLMCEFYFETCRRETFWLFLGFLDRGLL